MQVATVALVAALVPSSTMAYPQLTPWKLISRLVGVDVFSAPDAWFRANGFSGYYSPGNDGVRPGPYIVLERSKLQRLRPLFRRGVLPPGVSRGKVASALVLLGHELAHHRGAEFHEHDVFGDTVRDRPMIMREVDALLGKTRLPARQRKLLRHAAWEILGGVVTGAPPPPSIPPVDTTSPPPTIGL